MSFFSKEHGILIEGFSGGAIYKTLDVASKVEKKYTRIVVIVCDSGTKYLDTIYNDV